MSDYKHDFDQFFRRFSIAPHKKRIEVVEAGLRVLDGENTEAILYSAAKAGRILDCSRQTIWRLRKAGVLKPVNILGRQKYRRRDLIDLANNGFKLETEERTGTNS